MEVENVTEQWEAQDTAGHDIHGHTAVYDATGKDVAIVYDGEAHAQLIAAAPELLEALRRIVQETDCTGSDNCALCDGAVLLEQIDKAAK